MSAYYYFYSEVKAKNGKWKLLNQSRIYKKGKKPTVAETYYGQSWLYDVSELFDNSTKSYRLNKGEMSRGLYVEYYLDDDMNEDGFCGLCPLVAMDYEDLKNIYDKWEKKCGYVPVDEIEDYEKHHEPIFGEKTVKEYMKIKDPEVKSRFKWYEWYIDADTRASIGWIIEHHNWLLRDYKKLYDIYADDVESRIVMAINP